METKYLLPSEIARLVLGYLHQENCILAYKALLKESPNLGEYLAMLKLGREYPTSVAGKTLEQMLQEYAHMKLRDTIVLSNGNSSVGLWRQFDSLVSLLKQQTCSKQWEQFDHLVSVMKRQMCNKQIRPPVSGRTGRPRLCDRVEPKPKLATTTTTCTVTRLIQAKPIVRNTLLTGSTCSVYTDSKKDGYCGDDADKSLHNVSYTSFHSPCPSMETGSTDTDKSRVDFAGDRLHLNQANVLTPVRSNQKANVSNGDKVRSANCSSLLNQSIDSSPSKTLVRKDKCQTSQAESDFQVSKGVVSRGDSEVCKNNFQTDGKNDQVLKDGKGTTQDCQENKDDSCVSMQNCSVNQANKDDPGSVANSPYIDVEHCDDDSLPAASSSKSTASVTMASFTVVTSSGVTDKTRSGWDFAHSDVPSPFLEGGYVHVGTPQSVDKGPGTCSTLPKESEYGKVTPRRGKADTVSQSPSGTKICQLRSVEAKSGTTLSTPPRGKSPFRDTNGDESTSTFSQAANVTVPNRCEYVRADSVAVSSGSLPLSASLNQIASSCNSPILTTVAGTLYSCKSPMQMPVLHGEKESSGVNAFPKTPVKPNTPLPQPVANQSDNAMDSFETAFKAQHVPSERCAKVDGGDTEHHKTSPAFNCVSEMSNRFMGLKTPVKRNPCEVSQLSPCRSIASLDTESNKGRSPRRKRFAPRRRSIGTIGGVGKSGPPRPIKLRPPVRVVTPDPPEQDRPLHYEGSEDSMDLPTLIEQMLSNPQLQERLAENINRKLHPSTVAPFTQPPQPQSTVENQPGTPYGASLHSLEDILDMHETQMSEGAITSIIDMTRSDPAFDALFQIFDSEKNLDSSEREADHTHTSLTTHLYQELDQEENRQKQQADRFTETDASSALLELSMSGVEFAQRNSIETTGVSQEGVDAKGQDDKSTQQTRDGVFWTDQNQHFVTKADSCDGSRNTPYKGTCKTQIHSISDLASVNVSSKVGSPGNIFSHITSYCSGLKKTENLGTDKSRICQNAEFIQGSSSKMLGDVQSVNQEKRINVESDTLTPSVGKTTTENDCEHAANKSPICLNHGNRAFENLSSVTPEGLAYSPHTKSSAKSSSDLLNSTSRLQTRENETESDMRDSSKISSSENPTMGNYEVLVIVPNDSPSSEGRNSFPVTRQERTPSPSNRFCPSPRGSCKHFGTHTPFSSTPKSKRKNVVSTEHARTPDSEKKSESAHGYYNNNNTVTPGAKPSHALTISPGLAALLNMVPLLVTRDEAKQGLTAESDVSNAPGNSQKMASDYEEEKPHSTQECSGPQQVVTDDYTISPMVHLNDITISPDGKYVILPPCPATENKVTRVLLSSLVQVAQKSLSSSRKYCSASSQNSDNEVQSDVNNSDGLTSVAVASNSDVSTMKNCSASSQNSNSQAKSDVNNSDGVTSVAVASNSDISTGCPKSLFSTAASSASDQHPSSSAQASALHTCSIEHPVASTSGENLHHHISAESSQTEKLAESPWRKTDFVRPESCEQFASITQGTDKVTNTMQQDILSQAFQMTLGNDVDSCSPFQTPCKLETRSDKPEETVHSANKTRTSPTKKGNKSDVKSSTKGNIASADRSLDSPLDVNVAGSSEKKVPRSKSKAKEPKKMASETPTRRSLRLSVEKSGQCTTSLRSKTPPPSNELNVSTAYFISPTSSMKSLDSMPSPAKSCSSSESLPTGQQICVQSISMLRKPLHQRTLDFGVKHKVDLGRRPFRSFKSKYEALKEQMVHLPSSSKKPGRRKNSRIKDIFIAPKESNVDYSFTQIQSKDGFVVVQKQPENVPISAKKQQVAWPVAPSPQHVAPGNIPVIVQPSAGISVHAEGSRDHGVVGHNFVTASPALTRVNTSSADPTRVNTSSADLARVNTSAHLKGVNTSSAALTRVNTSSAPLTSVNTSSADLTRVNASSADLTRVNTSSADPTKENASLFSSKPKDLCGSMETSSSISTEKKTSASYVGQIGKIGCAISPAFKFSHSAKDAGKVEVFATSDKLSHPSPFVSTSKLLTGSSVKESSSQLHTKRSAHVENLTQSKDELHQQSLSLNAKYGLKFPVLQIHDISQEASEGEFSVTEQGQLKILHIPETNRKDNQTTQIHPQAKISKTTSSKSRKDRRKQTPTKQTNQKKAKKSESSCDGKNVSKKDKKQTSQKQESNGHKKPASEKKPTNGGRKRSPKKEVSKDKKQNKQKTKSDEKSASTKKDHEMDLETTKGEHRSKSVSAVFSSDLTTVDWTQISDAEDFTSRASEKKSSKQSRKRPATSTTQDIPMMPAIKKQKKDVDLSSLDVDKFLASVIYD